MKKIKHSAIKLPPVPIGHLTISQYEELREHIERITGHKLLLEIRDKKSKKKIITL